MSTEDFGTIGENVNTKGPIEEWGGRCQRCGAMVAVEDFELHDDWHALMAAGSFSETETP